MEAIIQVMESTIAARDPYTVEHQQRVTHIAKAIGENMGLSPEKLEALHVAGSLHDLGKIAVPTEILSKPGKLTELEFAIIKSHPQVAYNILKPLNFPKEITRIIMQHHERLNGSGYPHGLEGKEIDLGAKILGVADVLEAMCSHRPYRPALGIEKAMEEITKKRDILYDPDVVDSCVQIYQETPAVLLGEANYGARKLRKPLEALPEKVSHQPAAGREREALWRRLWPRFSPSQPRTILRVATALIIGWAIFLATRTHL